MKRVLLLGNLVIGALLASGSASGKELSIDGVKALQKQLKSSEYLTVDFKQDIYRSLRNRHTISSGIAYFRRPNKFHWILQKPKKMEWIYGGQTLVGIEGDSTIAKEYGVGNQQAHDLRQIVDMVMNFDSLLANYDVKHADDMGGSVMIELAPKSSGEITAAVLTIDREKNYITTVKLKYTSDENTTFTFTNPRLDPIAETTFGPPKGVTVKKEF
jgi:outer membrane lipoprotein-sorting protein